MAEHSLGSARLKLRRAEQHLDALSELHLAWDEQRPMDHSHVYVERDEASGRSWRVFAVTKLPPISADWGLIAGDAVHNTRCSLDHLVCALIEANGGNVTKASQFPIYDHTPDRRETQRIESNLAGMADEPQQRIKGMQPYIDPSSDRARRLVALATLDNQDKHRLVYVAAAALADEPEVTPQFPSAILQPREPSFAEGNEIVLARISLPSSVRSIAYSVRPAFVLPSIDLGELIEVHRNAVNIVEGFAKALGE